MAVNYFIPKQNTLYSISFQYNYDWWQVYANDYNSVCGRIIDGGPDQNTSDENLWQFFEVAKPACKLHLLHSKSNQKQSSLEKIRLSGH